LPTLKKYFHPTQTPTKPTILNSQNPIPTNHIQNLPFTPPHHTFFQILPNFSIPDYFNQQPIQFPSQFLTTQNSIPIQPKLLYLTIHPHHKQPYTISNQHIPLHQTPIIPIQPNFSHIPQAPSPPN
ncbi:alanine--tRNA ligase-related protein, partial [Staphylococcus saprophyticus]|uniref:alanine--tRNA ligase-related protein n=1 Tax=Staphylococcus saprophyticus TaxID=29385 RepID=UPI0021E69100